MKKSIAVKDNSQSKSIVNANRHSALKDLGEENVNNKRSDRKQLNEVAIVQNIKNNRNKFAYHIASKIKSTIE